MSQLYCGAARRCITPPGSLLPRLVGLKQHRFAGVLDDIHVRAAAGREAEKIRSDFANRIPEKSEISRYMRKGAAECFLQLFLRV